MKPMGQTYLYCFDLTFRPKIAVGSPFFVNAADVATSTQPDGQPTPLNGGCSSDYRDAPAKTYASNGSTDRRRRSASTLTSRGSAAPRS